MQGVTVAGRWLFAVALAVSVLVVSGSAQAQGAGYFEVLRLRGRRLIRLWRRAGRRGCLRRRRMRRGRRFFAGMRCLAGSGSL